MFSNPFSPDRRRVWAVLQVDMEGEGLMATQVSPSGEILIFGGHGGTVRLWSATSNPRISFYGHPAELPPVRPPKPAVPLTEADPLARAPQYYPAQVRRLESFPVGLEWFWRGFKRGTREVRNMLKR